MSNPKIAEYGKKTRFPVNRQDHTKKHPNGYFNPKLIRFLKKAIKYEDPETQKFIKGEAGDAVAWRLILNAAQGDNVAIKELLERLDGKVVQRLEGDGLGGQTKVQVIVIDGKDISGKAKRQTRKRNGIEEQAGEMLREQG